MKRTVFWLVFLGVLVMGSCQAKGPATPEARLAQIQELSAKGFEIASVPQEKIDGFVAEGKKLMADGKTEASVAALDRAIKVLERARDADTFNKAE